MRARIARIRALATFELRQQAREPLTTLYALVFLLLMIGFASSSAVELVRDRGAVPKDSAWTLWLAFGGLTAFGQVITTMVVVTAVLRDDALRFTPVLATTTTTAREWLLARLVAAASVLSLVFAALPVGAVAGFWLAGDTPLLPLAARVATPYLVLTLPSMLVVASVVGVTAALTRRVTMALAASLVLVGCWQTGMTLGARAQTRVIGALLDPFGNAPVLARSADWTAIERSVAVMPVDGLLSANRVLWLGLAAIALLVGLWWVHWGTASAGDTTASPRVPVRRRTSPGTIAAFTSQWISRDGGWRIVLLLAVANVMLNVVVNATDTLPAFLDSVRTHARVFLILLATVYAGEIVWRDRDVRVHELIDATAVRTATLARGRVIGLLRVQSVAAGTLAGVALVASLVFERSLPRVPWFEWMTIWAAWAAFHLWLPFLGWGVLSVAAHVVVGHKVAAHLLLITGWVVAVMLDAGGASVFWYRYAEPAPLMQGRGLAWTALLWRGGYWLSIAALLVLLIERRWPRGLTSRR
ncbi:MAG: hypothetical protein IT354_20505 [Gemmatimonadaceae bacterium]|nr:hypothetical protein [Gemmatimonadaceae bacterium]